MSWKVQIKESPLSVMSRATIESALSAQALDDLFARTAESGYTRELLFSTTVDLMSLVVSTKGHQVKSGYQQLLERVPVTLKCVYEKLQNIETVVSSALVRSVADRCGRLVTELGGACQALLPGYRVRILDGNHLAATQKRLKVVRGHSAGPLPGQSLAVLDPALMLVTDLIPCEDAHTQERALIGQVLPLVQKGDVWIEDRNFCTVDFLLGVQKARAHFVVRRHGNLTVQPQGEFGSEFETDTGWVSQRRVWVCRDGLRVLQARLVRVRLKQPTEDGDTEVEILTNLPAKVKATKVAELYLKRWKIEGAFHELTVALRCEVDTLGYPKAALFGVSVAGGGGNVLAGVEGGGGAGRGGGGGGMMLPLPAAKGKPFAQMPAAELAGHLRNWAGKINMRKIKKPPPRQPTKHKTKRIKDKSPHLSTARLLEEARKARQSKSQVPNQR